MNTQVIKYCKTCGDIGAMEGSAPECTNCWEVEKRLDDYARSEKGRKILLKVATEAEAKANHERMMRIGKSFQYECTTRIQVSPDDNHRRLLKQATAELLNCQALSEDNRKDGHRAFLTWKRQYPEHIVEAAKRKAALLRLGLKEINDGQ